MDTIPQTFNQESSFCSFLSFRHYISNCRGHFRIPEQYRMSDFKLIRTNKGQSGQNKLLLIWNYVTYNLHYFPVLQLGALYLLGIFNVRVTGMILKKNPRK